MSISLSVILPAFNAEKYIKEAIDSILDQTYHDFELLICDDCSTDQTKNIIRSYSDRRIRKHYNDVNIGKPLTVQKLFSYSKGKVLTFHDADDISFPERFDVMMKKMNDNPELGMCGHIIERITNKGKPLALYRNKIEDYEEIKMNMKKDNTDGDPSMFIRRNVLKELGEVFRPYFKNNMDYDLGLRIIEKYKTSNVLKVLSYYRNVPNSISKGVPTYKKLVTKHITKFLASERSNGLPDSLQRRDMEKIREMEQHYSIPYIQNPTLHLREMAAFFMYCRMNMTAIKYMLKAVEEEPKNWENWRALQYCIRKSLLSI